MIALNENKKKGNISKCRAALHYESHMKTSDKPKTSVCLRGCQKHSKPEKGFICTM